MGKLLRKFITTVITTGVFCIVSDFENPQEISLQENPNMYLLPCVMNGVAYPCFQTVAEVAYDSLAGDLPCS